MLTVLPAFRVGSMKDGVLSLLLIRWTCSTSKPHLCAHDHINFLDYPLSIDPSMAPHRRSTSPSYLESWTASFFHTYLSKILLLVLVLATAVRLFLVLSSRRRRIMASLGAEKETPANTGKASSRRVDSVQSADPNQHLHALKEELSQLSLKPIYPWIAPPTPLPGPYDAPYYPMPTLRKHSDPSTEEPEEIATATYTRRVSTNITPATNATLNGSLTVSNHGWRRSQWTVSTSTG
jgi:hypothetical protein